MNRLQKKCLVAAAGMHFLLVVVLLCSGFIKSKPKPDDSQLLEVIPAMAIDKALQSGVRGAQPPPPAPPTPPVTQPDPIKPPTPEPPKPEVKHFEPLKPIEPVKVQEPIEPEVPKPDVHTEPKPPKPPRKIVVDLKPVIRNKTTEPDHREEEARKAAELAAERKAELKAEREAERAAQRARDAQLQTFVLAARSIRDKTSSSTEVNMPGTSTAAYANFGVIVVSAYHHAWVAPENMASDSAVVSFSVTISRDGTVTSAHIVTSSGDANVDRAVQRMLNRVSFIHEFPDDSTDRERTYHIDFNATKTNIQ